MPVIETAGVPSNLIGICLSPGEVLTDKILNSLTPANNRIHGYVFRQELDKDNGLNLNLQITSEALGRLNPRVIKFFGVLKELDDAIFANCTQLESLHIGASSAPIFDEMPNNLLRQPLKNFTVNGYGVVIQGKSIYYVIEKVGDGFMVLC